MQQDQHADAAYDHAELPHEIALAELLEQADSADEARDAATPARLAGWTADRQRAFLEHLADGHTVGDACALVGLSPASAYALRRQARGQAFALGWRAALLVAREALADTFLARALNGQVDTYTRPDGAEVTRHRYDNRLGMTLLARLDRQAEGAGDADSCAARLVAGEFDAYLDCVAHDAAPARAGLFLARRTDPQHDARDLAPILALAAADRFARTGAATALDVVTDDLDPARRAGWTADQWSRAEAAGLLAFAAAPAPAETASHAETVSSSQLCQPVDSGPVWWGGAEWRTSFPPPGGFDGSENGSFGDEGYSRTLSDREIEQLEYPDRCEIAARWVVEARDRDRWFVEAAKIPGAIEDAEAETGECEVRFPSEDSRYEASRPGGSPPQDASSQDFPSGNDVALLRDIPIRKVRVSDPLAPVS